MTFEQACDEFAKLVLFAGIPNVSAKLEELGLEYRKGKNIDDLRKAVERGKKQGRAKTEFEIGMVAIQVKSVLKTRRKK